MFDTNTFIPTFKKIVRAAELPIDWARDFSNPNQLVVVTITDSRSASTLAGCQQIGHQINLAAPGDADKAALRAMSLQDQKHLYDAAIAKACAQAGRKISKKKIKSAAHSLPRHG